MGSHNMNIKGPYEPIFVSQLQEWLKMKVFESTLDNKYQVYVEKIEPYKGKLVLQEGDTVLNTWDVTISYDARFGADIDDIGYWQDLAADYVDNDI